MLLEQPVGEGDDAACVLGRNFSGAVAAARHLLDAGHRHVAFVIPGLAWPAVEERVRGFRDAVRRRGGATGLVYRCGPETPDAARIATEGLLRERPQITAVMAANDLLALGVLEAGRRAGRRCPADLAVVGFDDFDIAQWVDPPLTTVRLPGYDMGARACELLIARLEGGSFPRRRVELATELVCRGSS